MRPSTPEYVEGQDAPFVWAHRGASELAPENTIRSFLLAAELGAPGVELDVQLTRDGVPVVLHDPWVWADGDELLLRPPPGRPNLERLALAEHEWAELAGRPVRHEDGSEEVLARFEEVLEAVPGSIWLDVELKAGWNPDPRLVATALGCIRSRPERVLVSSFDHLVLREVATAAPDLPVLVIVHARPVDPAELCAAVPATRICIDRPFLTAADVPRWREAGLEVSVGGRELLVDLDEVCGWPLSGVFLDDPRRGLPQPGASGAAAREAAR